MTRAAERVEGRELDALTLARARRGEEAALSRVIERHAEGVHALVSRLLVGRPRAVVEDLCQDALCKVVRGLPGFDPAGPARLSTWVLSLAARTCIDWLRQERRRGRPRLAIEPDGPADPERLAGERELARRVERAMAELPEEQRAVLVLRAYHDLDYDEIATALGLELGTVKSRLGRARLALRQALALEGGA